MFMWFTDLCIPQTDGHYLNLPVMNDEKEIVGMVDVLKLTYATLEQVNSIGMDKPADAMVN
jgi:hypothetical protein